MSAILNGFEKVGCAVGCLGMAVAALIFGPGILFGSMMWMASERSVYSREQSPDGAFEARVQFDDCGAPCGYKRTVLVKRTWVPSDTPRLSCRAFLGDGVDRVRLEWVANASLIVHHGFADKYVLGSATSCGPVSIEAKFDPSLVSDES